MKSLSYPDLLLAQDPADNPASGGDTAVIDDPSHGQETPPKTTGKASAKEDLSGITAFATSFLGSERTVAPDDKKKEKDVPAPAAPAKPKAAKPAKPVAATPPPVSSLTPEQIADAAAEGAARGFKQASDGGKTAQDRSSAPQLSDEEQYTVSVLAKMAEMYPDKYKGISEKYQTSMKKLADYASRWEKDHPGQDFKEDDAEHEDFFKENDVDWEDSAYLKAAATIEAKAMVAEELKKTSETTNARLNEFERQEDLRKAIPVIYREVGKSVRKFWDSLGDETKGLLKDDGSADMDKFQALAAKDPVIHGIRLQAAQALDVEAAELYKLLGTPGVVDSKGNLKTLAKYDANNPIHVAMGNFASRMEETLAAKPVEERVNGKNQSFLPAAEYYKLPKYKQAQHWTFSAEDLAVLRANELASNTVKLIESEEQKLAAMAKARGWQTESKAPEPKQEQELVKEESLETTDGKPISPEGGSTPRVAAAKGASAASEQNPLSAFVSSFLK